MVQPLTIVIVILYVLIAASASASIVAAHYRAPGVTGIQGKDGPPGVAGATGTIGEEGPTGRTGTFYQRVFPLLGHTGMTGATGTATSQGPTGYAGNTGPTGGDTGPTGIRGPFGATPGVGPTGPTGPDGPTGAPGPSGPQTPGPVYGNILFNYSNSLPGPGVQIIPLTAMTFVRTLPVPVPPEFTMTPPGVIQFNAPGRSYYVRIGFNLTLSGLTPLWAPASVSLVGFPAPSTMPAITLYPAPRIASVAVVSLGSVHVYTVPPGPAPVFAPSVTINLTGWTSTTSVEISFLSITLEHVSDP